MGVGWCDRNELYPRQKYTDRIFAMQWYNQKVGSLRLSILIRSRDWLAVWTSEVRLRVIKFVGPFCDLIITLFVVNKSVIEVVEKVKRIVDAILRNWKMVLCFVIHTMGTVWGAGSYNLIKIGALRISERLGMLWSKSIYCWDLSVYLICDSCFFITIISIVS